MASNKYADIDKRVRVFIEGKHGRIGIVVPDRKPTEEEWRKFNQDIAEIVTRSLIRQGNQP